MPKAEEREGERKSDTESERQGRHARERDREMEREREGEIERKRERERGERDHTVSQLGAGSASSCFLTSASTALISGACVQMRIGRASTSCSACEKETRMRKE